MFLSSLDLLVVAIYAIALFAIAQYVSREPKGTLKSTEDYFLAGKSPVSYTHLTLPTTPYV